MMENLVPIFIAVTAAAVVLQAGILVGLYVAARKTTAKLESEIAELKLKALPIMSSTDAMLIELRPKVLQIVDTLVELRPKVNIVVDNLAETSATVRSEIQRVEI